MTDVSEFAGAYWVVIPAYNEAATVRDVALRARQQCPHVIVVDDGSTDGTAGVLDGLDVTLLRNEKNFGKAGSLCRGFELALAGGATGVITLDADGQHAPEEIPLFLAAAAQDSSRFLLGVRRRDQRRAWFWRYFANRVADFWIGWAAGFPVEDSQSGFRLYPTVVLQGVAVPHDRARSFVFESEILIEAVQRGFSCRSVPVTALSRSGPCPSHFRPLADIAGITRMVAWRLLSAGFNPSGLWRVLRRAEPRSDPQRVLRAHHEQKTESR